MMRLRAPSALLLVLQLALAALLVEQPPALLLLAGLAGLYWVSGPSRRHVWWVGAALILSTWSICITQGLFYQGWPRTPLFTLVPAAWFPQGEGGLVLYREGLWHGLVQSLRLDVMLLLGAGLLGRYAADELTAALAVLRLPRVLGFLVAVVLRYLPLMLGELRTIWTAQRMRGLRIGGDNWRFAPWHTARAGRALLVPLLAGTIRRADEIATALHSRGFSVQAVPREPRAALAWPERMVVAGGWTLLAALAGAYLLTRLHLAGVYSLPRLQGLYAWVVAYV